MRDQLTDFMNWMRWLDTMDCICAYKKMGLGILHGVNCGDGWVRLTTEFKCVHHGKVPRRPKVYA